MLALLFDGDCKVHVEDRPVPPRKEGEVVVKVAYSGVCQTDFRRYAGTGSKNVMGHEFTGCVVEAGPENSRLRAGDRVVCYAFLPCRACHVCRSGRSQVCPNRTSVNQLVQGGFAEYVSYPEDAFLPLPDDIADDLGVLVLDVFGMMYHGMRRMQLGPASVVAVIGLQPYGLGGVCIAKMTGAKVIGFDSSSYRRQLATQLGADRVVDSTADSLDDTVMDVTDGRLFENIVECDEPAIPIERLFSWVQPGGTLCLMGHTTRPVTFQPNWVTLNEVTVIGTPLYNPQEHFDIVELVRRCEEAPKIITHRPPLEAAKPALDEYVKGRAGKVAFDLSSRR